MQYKEFAQQSTIEVPCITGLDTLNRSAVADQLNALLRHPLNQVCWNNQLVNVPDVHFVIAYSDEALLVKYYVSEASHKAVYTKPNDPVFKDSCVEFFVSVDDSGYYNFEFNSLGTCLASYGINRYNRAKLDAKIISTINCWTSWDRYSPELNQYEWELTFVLTPDVFHHHDLKGFSGSSLKANFYKCGDELTEPHFLAWNKVQTSVPDFHQPEYFGSLQL